MLPPPNHEALIAAQKNFRLQSRLPDFKATVQAAQARSFKGQVPPYVDPCESEMVIDTLDDLLLHADLTEDQEFEFRKDLSAARARLFQEAA